MCFPSRPKRNGKFDTHAYAHARPCSLTSSSSNKRNRSSLPSFTSSAFQSYEREKEREVQRAKIRAHESILLDVSAVDNLKSKLGVGSPTGNNVNVEDAVSKAILKVEKEREEREKERERECREQEREQRDKEIVQKLEKIEREREERACRCREEKEWENQSTSIQAMSKLLEGERKERELERLSNVRGIGYLGWNNGYGGVGGWNNGLLAPVRQGLIAASVLDDTDHRVTRLEARQRQFEDDQLAMMRGQRRFY